MSAAPSRALSGPYPPPPPSTPTRAQASQQPRVQGSLRKLRSAYTLSSHTSNGNPPSLITLQRQQPPPPPQQQHPQPPLHPHPPRLHQSRSTSFTVNRDRNRDRPAVAPPLPSHIHLPQTPSHARTRSNSDAVPASASAQAPSHKRHTAAKKLPVDGGHGGHGGRMATSLEMMVRDGPQEATLRESLEAMRYQILRDGVNSDPDGMSALRIYVWLILLCVPPLATDEYLRLIHRGPSPAYAKIRNDTFRTLTTDPLFRRRVSEASLIRLLNAFVWTLHEAREKGRKAGMSPMPTSDGSPEMRPVMPVRAMSPSLDGVSGLTGDERSDVGGAAAGTYVQGMNVLAAPFLYAARSEAEAFAAFHRFITFECPGYVRGAMDGVHRGLALVDRVLAIVDPKLSDYLLSKQLHAKLYAFPSVLTLCACTPPLPEVLHLWDFLFAYGSHLNIFCIVAQLILARDVLFASPSPVKILRSFPPLQAMTIKGLAVSLVSRIPLELYDEIVRHALPLRFRVGYRPSAYEVPWALAFAGLRLAVIVQGIIARARLGVASGAGLVLSAEAGRGSQRESQGQGEEEGQLMGKSMNRGAGTVIGYR
ncbi:MAG: hypothetical protein M1826_006880 [Phylliscum demangeonii]|nr:MAG: hypothetical protein M1826_006880 [Phylliscum demangeonii]